MKFYNNLPIYILLLLIIFAISTSFYRFIIKKDYLVGYEGICDPAVESCFVGCEDDACTQEYYYSKMVKYAPDLYKECDKDITDCEMANSCLPEDKNCSITYCDTEVDGDTCKTSIEETNTQNDDKGVTKEDSSQNNNINNN